ncbi:SDR family oxidoreductase [Paenibacillus sp. S3N08]|uniref:SDR family oxidoreductase n=2 Tax=Paenibacillus agricola TaxID=2716264 RepID=A0ABX0J7Q9_9BACL|nr:SDR family oxidoreductase [Paenibacillus agricola]
MSAYMNKVVIITGAGGGIGRTLAMSYASEAAKVALFDKDEQKLRETQRLIEEAGYEEAYGRVLDLSDSHAIAPAIQAVADQFGHIDILINNAGLGRSKSPYELDIDDWDYVIDTNLRATFLCSREAAKVMRKTGKGSIINMASTRAEMSEPNTEAYAASKGGIIALTHALAISLGKDGIQVNAISPGWIETGDYNALGLADHQQHPAGRVGKPEDIARACLYLTAPDNDFVTGINLTIDGGMTRKMIYLE